MFAWLRSIFNKKASEQVAPTPTTASPAQEVAALMGEEFWQSYDNFCAELSIVQTDDDDYDAYYNAMRHTNVCLPMIKQLQQMIKNYGPISIDDVNKALRTEASREPLTTYESLEDLLLEAVNNIKTAQAHRYYTLFRFERQCEKINAAELSGQERNALDNFLLLFDDARDDLLNGNNVDHIKHSLKEAHQQLLQQLRPEFQQACQPDFDLLDEFDL